MYKRIHNHVVIALLVFISFNAKVLQANSQTDTIKVQLIYKHQFQFAGFYAAIHKGFYQDVGLNVALLLPNGEAGSTTQLLAGESHIGIGSHGLVKKRVDGAPIILLASIFQHSPQALITSDNSGINNIKDLAGKRVMIEKHAIDLLAFMADEGLNDGMIVEIPYDYNVYNLIDNKVDAMSVYLTDNTYLLDALKFPYRIISPLSGGIDFYGDSIFTTEDYYLNNSEKVKSFIDATIKGYNYALDNKQEIINLIIEQYDADLSKDHLLYEANKMEDFIARDIVEIGHINEGRWRYTLDVYKKLNLVDKNSSLDGFFLSDYDRNYLKRIPIETIILYLTILVILVVVALIYVTNSIKLKQQLRKSLELEKHLKHANDTKDQLISIIAHDLKNPFSGIISLSSLVLLDLDSINREELKNSLRLIRNSAEDAYQMLKNLLEWVLIQQDGIMVRARIVPLLKEYAHIFDVYKEQAQSKKINFELDIHPEHRLFVDPHMLEVIVRNILTNAIKFTNEQGSIWVTTYKKHHKSKTPHTTNLVLEIKDTGVGISEENISRILAGELLESTPGTNKEKGTGLGLTLCREFVAANKGELHISSEIGIGSVFSIELPTSSMD